jgi:hypothetical protein
MWFLGPLFQQIYLKCSKHHNINLTYTVVKMGSLPFSCRYSIISTVVISSDYETGPTQAISSSQRTTSNASRVTHMKYFHSTKTQMQFDLGKAYEHYSEATTTKAAFPCNIKPTSLCS